MDGPLDRRVAEFDAPQAFAKPYHENLTLTLAPEEELIEFVCENNKPEHLVANP